MSHKRRGDATRPREALGHDEIPMHPLWLQLLCWLGLGALGAVAAALAWARHPSDAERTHAHALHERADRLSADLERWSGQLEHPRDPS